MRGSKTCTADGPLSDEHFFPLRALNMKDTEDWRREVGRQLKRSGWTKPADPWDRGCDEAPLPGSILAMTLWPQEQRRLKRALPWERDWAEAVAAVDAEDDGEEALVREGGADRVFVALGGAPAEARDRESLRHWFGGHLCTVLDPNTEPLEPPGAPSSILRMRHAERRGEYELAHWPSSKQALLDAGWGGPNDGRTAAWLQGLVQRARHGSGAADLPDLLECLRDALSTVARERWAGKAIRIIPCPACKGAFPVSALHRSKYCGSNCKAHRYDRDLPERVASGVATSAC